MNINRKNIFAKYKGHCAYCGCEISTYSFNVDHLVSKRSGGSNDPSNLMPSCRSCNLWKTACDLEDFRYRVASQVDKCHRYSRNFKLAYRFGLVKETNEEVVFYFERVLPESEVSEDEL